MNNSNKFNTVLILLWIYFDEVLKRVKLSDAISEMKRNEVCIRTRMQVLHFILINFEAE